MKHLFYLIGVMFIIHELRWIIAPTKQVLKVKRRKDFKWKGWEKFTEEQKSDVIGLLFNFLIFVWLIVGLFTFNWIAFITISIFNILIIAPISKLLQFSIGYTVIHWINSVIGLAFGIFVIINSYHLKIDLYQLISNYFNF